MGKRKREKSRSVKVSGNISPSNLRRAPQSVLVNPADLPTLNAATDPTFQKLWLQCQFGLMPLVATRISINRIQAGFSRVSTNGSVEIIDDPPPQEAITQRLCEELRQGRRQPLMIYKGGQYDTAEFVDSDTTPRLHAYRRLGIEKVPVTIINGTVEDLEETGFKYTLAMGRNGNECIYNVEIWRDAMLPLEHKAHSYLSAKNAKTYEPIEIKNIETFLRSLEILQERLEASLVRLRSFHMPSNSQLHYHHCLSSVLCRAVRIIASMQLLAENEYIDQGLILTRSLYELSILLYLDWIMPETIGQYLATLPLIDKEWDSYVKEAHQIHIESGWGKAAADEFSSSQQRLRNYVSKIKSRAMISPHRFYHEAVYKMLSSSAHQDFITGAAYTNSISTSLNPTVIDVTEKEGYMQKIVRISDLSVALICVCINKDTGG